MYYGVLCVEETRAAARLCAVCMVYADILSTIGCDGVWGLLLLYVGICFCRCTYVYACSVRVSTYKCVCTYVTYSILKRLRTLNL